MRSHVVLRRDLRAFSLLAVFLSATLQVPDRSIVAAENTATQPVPRDAGWVKRHENFVEIAKRGGVDLLFLGDSITNAWGGEGNGGGGGTKTIEVNKIISHFDDGKMVRYLDIGPKFLEQDGSLSKEIMPDFLHLTEKGYQIWADAVTPALTGMLGK